MKLFSPAFSKRLLPCKYPQCGRRPLLARPVLCGGRRRGVLTGGPNYYLTADFTPVRAAQEALDAVHAATGLPWWASITVTAWTLRTVVTLPLAVYTNIILARVELLQPEILGLSRTLKLEVSRAVREFNWSKKYARFKYNATMKKLIKELYIRDNCHPAKATLLIWIQLPMWFSLSLALRYMSGMVSLSSDVSSAWHHQMKTGGALWFSDLTVPDGTWVLPVTLGVINLLLIELFNIRAKNPTRFQRFITYLLRGVAVAMVPISAAVPTCMCWYWVCSSFYGLIQNVVFIFPRVRRLLHIPKTPNESLTPLRDIYQVSKTKYTWRK